MSCYLSYMQAVILLGIPLQMYLPKCVLVCVCVFANTFGKDRMHLALGNYRISILTAFQY